MRYSKRACKVLFDSVWSVESKGDIEFLACRIIESKQKKKLFIKIHSFYHQIVNVIVSKGKTVKLITIYTALSTRFLQIITYTQYIAHKDYTQSKEIEQKNRKISLFE